MSQEYSVSGAVHGVPFPSFVRGAYNYDRDAASEFSGVSFKEESLTVQSEKEEADINVLVKRFGLTGELPTDVRAPTYGDFTDVWDFRSAQDAIISARNAFNEMPAEVRARFNNDPALFVDFCSDGKNVEEMIRLGLAVKVESLEPAVDKKQPKAKNKPDQKPADSLPAEDQE